MNLQIWAVVVVQLQMTVDRLAVAQLEVVRWVEVLVCTCSQMQADVH